KGTAKVLDFGLAKLLQTPDSQDGTRDLTASQGTVGTLPYMAPEQLQGEPVDPRTDLHAVGLILYEMATGRRAFQEELASRLIDAIVRRSPVSPRAIQERISPEFERIILKCLEKNPEDRYQSARELEVDLRRLVSPTSAPMTIPSVVRPKRSRRTQWYAVAGAVILAALALAFLLVSRTGSLWHRAEPSGAAAPAINSIAVLPLENLSRNPSQEYFADGMTDELITSLSQIGALRVIARSSVMRYKHSDVPVATIAKQLNVSAVVEGSVLSADGQVRITAQLIQPATDQNLWAQSYEGSLKDVIALQNSVARDIADQIRVRLEPAVKTRLAEGKAVNPQAFQAYLKGRYFWAMRNRKAATTSLQYFQESVRDDPAYAVGYAGLAETYSAMVSNVWIPPEVGLPAATAAARKALELDPQLAQAYTALGEIAKIEWHWQESDQDFQRALQLNPGYALARQWYSSLLAEIGRTAEAVVEARRAAALDPLSPISVANVGQTLYLARRYGDASEELQKVIAANPDFFAAYYLAGITKIQESDFAGGIADLEKADHLAPDDPQTLAALAYAYARAGQRAMAETALQRLKGGSGAAPVSPFLLAQPEAGLGEEDRAIRSLELAYQQHAVGLPLIRSSPMFDSLRSNPRFQALLAKLGLAGQSFTH
ncbi:MAG: protein kinase, partial [Acidobacteriota bacterium]|nr:protein kinase [Acidobacteriota bacterium]